MRGCAALRRPGSAGPQRPRRTRGKRLAYRLPYRWELLARWALLVSQGVMSRLGCMCSAAADAGLDCTRSRCSRSSERTRFPRPRTMRIDGLNRPGEAQLTRTTPRAAPDGSLRHVDMSQPAPYPGLGKGLKRQEQGRHWYRVEKNTCLGEGPECAIPKYLACSDP